MKNLATDTIVDDGLAAAVRNALKADDPVAALEANLRRMAQEMASERVYKAQRPNWGKVFTGVELAKGGKNCDCGSPAPEETDLSSLLGMDDHEFVAATNGRRWEKLMR